MKSIRNGKDTLFKFDFVISLQYVLGTIRYNISIKTEFTISARIYLLYVTSNC